MDRRVAVLINHDQVAPANYGPGVTTELNPASTLKRTHDASPIYPLTALAAGVRGDVDLKITVDKAGNVSSVKALSGHPLLIKAAESAVEQWKFAPPADAPVETTAAVHFWLRVEEPATVNTTGGPLVEAGKHRPSTIYKMVPGILPPRAIHSPDPPYTDQARKMSVQGDVVLATVVSAQGRVVTLEAISKPLGMRLDESALKTVSEWRFSPGERDGKPVAVRVIIDVRFRLR